MPLSDDLFVAHVKRWWRDGKGLMASKSVSVVHCLPIVFADISSLNSGGDAGIKMRPTNEELLSMSPEFDHKWSTYFANAPDKPVMVVLPLVL
jgi:alcohol oxidase